MAARRSSRRARHKLAIFSVLFYALLLSNRSEGAPLTSAPVCGKGGGQLFNYLQQLRHDHCFNMWQKGPHRHKSCPRTAGACCKRSDCHDSEVYECSCLESCGRYVCQIRRGNCAPLLPPKNGYYVAASNTAVRLQCNTGYYVSGEPEISCLNRTWTPIRHSCKAHCRKPPLLRTSQHIRYLPALNAEKKEYAQGSVVRLRCSQGYNIRGLFNKNRLKASIRITCNSRGKWQPRIKKLRCIPKCCELPSHPSNGQLKLVSSTGKEFCGSDRVNFLCNKCFKVVGHRSTTCFDLKQIKGAFSMPTCKRVTCGPLKLPEGASFNHFSTDCGSTVNISCSTHGPYRGIAGFQIVTCSENGEWSLKAGSVRKLRCIPSVIRSLTSSSYPTRVQLTWQAPEHMYVFIAKYVIRLIDAGYGDFEKNVTVIVNDPSQTSPGDVYDRTINNLQPGTAYLVEVTPYTQQGVAGHSSSARLIKTLALKSTPLSIEPTVKTTIPSASWNLACQTSSTDRFNISWQPPENTAEHFEYHVSFSAPKPIRTTDYKQSGTMKTNNTWAELVDLEPYRLYDIVITARRAGNSRISANVMCSYTPMNYTLDQLPEPKLEKRNATTAVILLNTTGDERVKRYSVLIEEIPENANGLVDSFESFVVIIPADTKAWSGRTVIPFTLGDLNQFKQRRKLRSGSIYFVQWRSFLSPDISSPWSDRLLILPSTMRSKR